MKARRVHWIDSSLFFWVRYDSIMTFVFIKGQRKYVKVFLKLISMLINHKTIFQFPLTLKVA